MQQQLLEFRNQFKYSYIHGGPEPPNSARPQKIAAGLKLRAGNDTSFGAGPNFVAQGPGEYRNLGSGSTIPAAIVYRQSIHLQFDEQRRIHSKPN